MCLAVPGRVISLEDRDDTLMAEVDFGGVRKEVCLEYLPDVAVGEYVVVHVGFAIQRLDEESATATLDSFERLGILDEEFGDGFALAARQAGVRREDERRGAVRREEERRGDVRREDERRGDVRREDERRGGDAHGVEETSR